MTRHFWERSDSTRSKAFVAKIPAAPKDGGKKLARKSGHAQISSSKILGAKLPSKGGSRPVPGRSKVAKKSTKLNEVTGNADMRAALGEEIVENGLGDEGEHEGYV